MKSNGWYFGSDCCLRHLFCRFHQQRYAFLSVSYLHVLQIYDENINEVSCLKVCCIIIYNLKRSNNVVYENGRCRLLLRFGEVNERKALVTPPRDFCRLDVPLRQSILKIFLLCEFCGRRILQERRIFVSYL